MEKIHLLLVVSDLFLIEFLPMKDYVEHEKERTQ
jgi:hypothetical protein